ncbi:hypothetical protein HGG71_08030 [Rhodobacteraceae bacterium R_SAG2]|nr:hypothetical protein [Rhodobacteraceae bacterium R_SAG2]
MKSVLIWGFYNQGNIGDDLMGMMLYEMLEELGALPIIYTSNTRFSEMGYRTVNTLAGLKVDLVILGGGAFFKEASSSKSAIEEQVAMLGRFVNENAVPTHAMSIGRDGVDRLSAMSVARRSIIQGGNFRSVALRLKSDLELKLPSAVYLPDIVLLTQFCSERYKRLNPVEPVEFRNRTLINLSRRSAINLPRTLWRVRRNQPAFFRAHTSMGNTGGEIAFPGLPVIEDESIVAQLGYIKASRGVVSSKLHPGVIALSFGKPFEAISPRPKTIAFLSETPVDNIDFAELHGQYCFHMKKILK